MATSSVADATAGAAGIRLRSAYPQVFVSDLARVVTFYETALGFRTAYLHGEPPFYGLVVRDGAGLNLRHVDTAVLDRARQEAEILLTANIPVEGVSVLHAAFEARGVPFAQDLRLQPWAPGISSCAIPTET